MLNEDLTATNLPVALDQIAAAKVRYLALVDEAEPIRAQIAAEHAAREARAEADRAERRARQEAGEQAQRAEAQVREAERASWVAAHGSDYLKRATAGGYDCQRRYAGERAVLEHPRAVLDYEDNADWRSCSCPSEAALDMAGRVHGTVVWLTREPWPTRPTDQEYDADPFEPCEAVIVERWLGKYTIVYTYTI